MSNESFPYERFNFFIECLIRDLNDFCIIGHYDLKKNKKGQIKLIHINLLYSGKKMKYSFHPKKLDSSSDMLVYLKNDIMMKAKKKFKVGYSYVKV